MIKLDKNFVKDLSLKLLEWTNQRWIISFSKTEGNYSIKEQEKMKQKDKLIEFKNSKFFGDIKKKFTDIELVDLKQLMEKKMTDFSKILDKAKELEQKMKDSQEKIKK